MTADTPPGWLHIQACAHVTAPPQIYLQASAFEASNVNERVGLGNGGWWWTVHHTSGTKRWEEFSLTPPLHQSISPPRGCFITAVYGYTLALFQGCKHVTSNFLLNHVSLTNKKKK